MYYRQIGFGGMQMIIAICVVAGLSTVAMPKYTSFMTKSKITEAFNLAGESKRKLAQFMMVNNRFPKTMNEAKPMETTTLSPPKFVRKLQVVPGFRNHDVVVKVYLKDGVVENESGQEQFIYLAGDVSAGEGSSVVWSCGSNGISADLLPDNCGG